MFEPTGTGNDLSVNAFSMKVLIKVNIFISPTGDMTALPFYLVI